MNPNIDARFHLDHGRFQLTVDLQLPGSGISVLFGPSGSGKTTLLRCIAGLQRAPSGYLQINQQVWQDSDRGLFIPAHQRSLGYVFQEANLFPHLSVTGNLQFGMKRSPTAQPDQLPAIVELLDIGHLLQRLPHQLSGGERQRVAIARALLLNPDILLMDEPMASLDDARKLEIMPFLDRLHRQLNIPVLYVTHSRQEVARLADYLVVMDAGKLVTCGPLSATLNRINTPLAHDREASSVWQVTIIGHEPEYHLTQVGFAGGSLSLTRVAGDIGTPLRIQIHARDVSITRQPPVASSILNVLPAYVIDMADADHGHTVVRLRIRHDTPNTPGEPPQVLAHITRKSQQLLALQPDMPVYVQIKGTSILN